MIETERLILRPFREDDYIDVFEYLHIPEVNCFWCMKLDTLEDAKKEMMNRSTDTYFAICLKENNKVIGEIEAYPEKDMNDTYSPCWMLNKEYQNKGYAYEAAVAFFDYLFYVKKVRRIFAYTEDYNFSSQRLCEKLGLRKEGFFKEFVSFVNDDNGNPIYENTMQYAILNKEWRK